MFGFTSFSSKPFSYISEIEVLFGDFRITEANDFRTTQNGLFRVIELNYSTSTLTGTSSLEAASSYIYKGNLELQNTSLLTGEPDIVPFESDLYAKYNLNWEPAISYVKYNNIWVTPIYIGIKVNGAWKRVK
jgi:hypothetical protein